MEKVIGEGKGEGMIVVMESGDVKKGLVGGGGKNVDEEGREYGGCLYDVIMKDVIGMVEKRLGSYREGEDGGMGGL